MKILLAHNHYLIPGGEDESFRMEYALLTEHGHTVVKWEEDNRRVQELGSLRTAFRTIWSAETYQKISALLKDGSFDLVMVQNFFPLISPSIYYAAHKAHVPVMQALRNYRLTCLNGYFFREGKTCEACLGKSFSSPGIRYRCYRDSRAGSMVVALMQWIHRLLGTWKSKVDAYILLTPFTANKFVEMGLPKEKIFIRPNFLPEVPKYRSQNEEYALFVGRNSPEKGSSVVKEAWSQLPAPIPLIGLGASQAEMGWKIPGVEWKGQLPNDEVLRWVSSSRMIIFPSLWFECFPRVILEAMAYGVPVIASRLGSMPEIVQDNVTGLLFEPGNPLDLAEKVHWLWTHESVRQAMGIAARKEYELKYTSTTAYQRLMEIYNSINLAELELRRR